MWNISGYIMLMESACADKTGAVSPLLPDGTEVPGPVRALQDMQNQPDRKERNFKCQLKSQERFVSE